LTVLTDLLDTAEKYVRHVIVENQEELLPVFELRNASGDSFVVGAPFVGDSPEEVADCKDMVAGVIRHLIIEHKIVAYSFMSEAWMIVRHKWTPGVSTAPADSADRVEVVMAIATDGAEYLHRRWLIKRKGKRCVDLTLDSTGETIEPSGRFDRLLTPLKKESVDL
jgi:hypothetical protein